MPDFLAFFICTEVLTIDSFNALKGEFESWALRQLLTIQITIAEQINAQTYNEVFKTIYGEKEKEEAEAESENSVG
jgi:hypothetical protein